MLAGGGKKPMTSKFVSFLETVGRDFQKGLSFILPYAESAGEAAVAIYAPALGPMFNSTVSAVVLAEQKYAALGKQSGTGTSKLSDVVQLIGPLIAKGLQDAGKAADAAAVNGYINSVVTILNTTPAPAPATP
jgi:hypothetical protein